MCFTVHNVPSQSTPGQDQLLVYVAAEFAATLFPDDKMFTLGSADEPNDNPTYTNPALSYSTAYTYFVICLPDTTPDSLNVRVFSHTIGAHTALGCWYCLFVSQDPVGQRVSNYALAGYSSFGSEYVTPAGERCSACSLESQQCILLLHSPPPSPPFLCT